MTRILYALLLSLLLSACRPQPQAAPELTPVPAAAPVAPTPTPTGSTPTAPTPASGLLMRLETDGDLAVGAVPVVVYILENGEGIDGATVEVTGDMTHAGMAPVTTQATETEPGLYRAEAFEFTMAGDWLLTAVATLPSGEQTSTELSVTVPGQ